MSFFPFLFFFSLLACCNLGSLGPELRKKVFLFVCFLAFMLLGLLAQAPGRGPLHGGPLRSRVRGLSPLAPRPQSHLTHPLSAGLLRFLLNIFPALTECVGSQRHRARLSSAWSYLAPLASPVDFQACGSVGVQGFSLFSSTPYSYCAAPW